jgi:DNA-directed RNA polymerase subunit E'/Rpb7
MREAIKKEPRASFEIYVVEQTDEHKFNRGILLNIGFLEALKDGRNIFIFHDADLVPKDSDDLMALYVKYPEIPIHIAKCWDRYTGNKEYNYLGGILSISEKDFKNANGFPNNFYGWGGEDDEFALRLKENRVEIEDPSQTLEEDDCVIEDLEDLDLLQKISSLRGDTERKNNIKRERLAQHKDTWRQNGLEGIGGLYEIQFEEQRTIGMDKYTLINVKIVEEPPLVPFQPRSPDVSPPRTPDGTPPLRFQPMSPDGPPPPLQQPTRRAAHQDKNSSIYSKCLITKPVVLDITQIRGDLKETLKSKIASAFEGKCAVEGYVKPNSCDIVSYSCGVVERGNSICFIVAFECFICFPVEGQIIECYVKNVTKAGIRAELYQRQVHGVDEETSPVVVFVARDHYYSDSDFSDVKVSENIFVTVIGQRFELNDKYVSVIARLQKKPKQRK